jgi:hypothetical protein
MCDFGALPSLVGIKVRLHEHRVQQPERDEAKDQTPILFFPLTKKHFFFGKKNNLGGISGHTHTLSLIYWWLIGGCIGSLRGRRSE